MKTLKHNKHRTGAALLIVLFTIMVLTITGITFIARSNTELACGNNMVVRAQMDNLAESGLEQGMGLLTRPWDISDPNGKYWSGQSAMQLDTDTDDYYSVDVVRSSSGSTARCLYDITSSAYRLKNGDVTSQSSITAKLRFDPAVGLWLGGNMPLDNGVIVNGDVYGDFMITNSGIIRGDVYCSDMVSNLGTVTGQTSEFVVTKPVDNSNISYTDFTTSYKYDDGSTYSVSAITTGSYDSETWQYSGSNPAGVFYCNGDLILNGNIDFDGMLVVNGNLTVSGTNNNFSAVKNFPALIVNGGIQIQTATSMNIDGLVQVRDFVMFDPGASNVDVVINGAMVCQFGGIVSFFNTMGTFVINADPIEAAVQVWPGAMFGSNYQWMPAGGAFIKQVSR